MMNHTFKSKDWRVQLSVYDMTHYEKWRVVKFFVSVLPTSFDPNTKFSIRPPVSMGYDFIEAMGVVRRYIPTSTTPKKMIPYENMATRGEIYNESKQHEWEEFGRKETENYLKRQKEKLLQMYPHLKK